MYRSGHQQDETFDVVQVFQTLDDQHCREIMLQRLNQMRIDRCSERTLRRLGDRPLHHLPLVVGQMLGSIDGKYTDGDHTHEECHRPEGQRIDVVAQEPHCR
jgi:hypothetical protein